MLFLMMLFSVNAFAENTNICGAVVSANEVLNCVKTNSPEIQSLNLERESMLSGSKAARRWLNPQITNQSLFDTTASSKYEVQLGVLQTLEFGAKRAYKRNLAESLEKKADASFQIGVGEELIATGADLVRFNQVNAEIESVNEAVKTFNQLVGQFANRPRLSPEQEVSVAVYRLSKGDFLIKRNSLDREKQEILIRFKSKLDLAESDLLRITQSIKINLPSVKVSEFPEESSPEMRRIESEVASSISDLSLARSDLFSELQVGPMAQFDADGATKRQMIGFQFNLPIPVWNQNGYAISAAAQKLKAMEIRSVVEKKAVREEWTRLHQNYEQFKTLLENVPSTNELESRHRKVEGQIYRGLVNSALVVESHRSLIDLQKSRHEAEVAALKTLWQIFLIQGKVSEIRL